MALILSIETATAVCSVAVHRGDDILGTQELYLQKSHSTHLSVMIEQLLDNCQIDIQGLEAIAVSKGPGSYTGLRIGVATAKGLCYGLGIPLIGVNTLEAMAHQIKTYPISYDYLCPMIDARRMEVYCTILNADFQVVAKTWAEVITEDSFKEWRQRGKVLFFGNGSEKCKEVIMGTNSIFVNDVQPLAKSIGCIASSKYSGGQTENLAYFEPFYLKEFRTTVAKNKMRLVNERK